MVACWKQDISRNEGEELLILWRQRVVANMCGMCVTSTREKQYWLLPAVRPSILRCPLFTSSCWAQQKQQCGFAGFAHKRWKSQVFQFVFCFLCVFFFHCFMFSRLFGERVSNVWIQTSFTAVFKRNHKMWIMVLSRSTSARTRAEDEVLSVLSS